MKFSLMTRIVAMSLVCLATAAVRCRAEKPQEEEMLAKDLEQLQGTWELVRQVQGRTLRSVKVITGHKTTLTRHDQQGTAYWAHTSQFKIAISGRVRIFTFFNLDVTAGPSKGQRVEYSTSFIYRVDSHSLIEGHGLMIGQNDGEPRLVVWKRVHKKVASHGTRTTPNGS